jgi:hypothetical protein
LGSRPEPASTPSLVPGGAARTAGREPRTTATAWLSDGAATELGQPSSASPSATPSALWGATGHPGESTLILARAPSVVILEASWSGAIAGTVGDRWLLALPERHRTDSFNAALVERIASRAGRLRSRLGPMASGLARAAGIFGGGSPERSPGGSGGGGWSPRLRLGYAPNRPRARSCLTVKASPTAKVPRPMAT